MRTVTGWAVVRQRDRLFLGGIGIGVHKGESEIGSGLAHPIAYRCTRGTDSYTCAFQLGRCNNSGASQPD
jgi:hypothetical protein